MAQTLKNLSLQILRIGTIFITALAIIVPSGFFINQQAQEYIALQDCVLEIEPMVKPELVKNEEIVSNCGTVKERVAGLLEEFGNKNVFPVYITSANKTACGEGTLGCVVSYYVNGMHLQYMTISITSDYYPGGLRQTVAHEYVHTLTNEKEREWLNAHKDIFPEGTDPSEIIADCGIQQIAGEFSGGAYISECSAALTDISTKIINDTLV